VFKYNIFHFKNIFFLVFQIYIEFEKYILEVLHSFSLQVFHCFSNKKNEQNIFFFYIQILFSQAIIKIIFYMYFFHV
jgi:hypothetical protein